MHHPPHYLSVGARGWQHPGWRDNYYPDDLPEDWRLDFYANEFRQVLLPFEAWSAIGPDEVGEWIDATDTGFRFFVEMGENRLSPITLTLLQVLRIRLGGICIDADISIDDGAEMARLAPLYRRGPQVAMTPFSNPKQWLPVDARSGNARLVIASNGGGHHALQLRGCAEALLGSGGGRDETLVFFDGKPPPLGDMRVLQQLGELLAT